MRSGTINRMNENGYKLLNDDLQLSGNKERVGGEESEGVHLVVHIV